MSLKFKSEDGVTKVLRYGFVAEFRALRWSADELRAIADKLDRLKGVGK